MRVLLLPIIVVGISTLSTCFAQPQQYHSRSSNMCSKADQSTCCEKMLELDLLVEASQFCIEHGCNQNICTGKPSGSGYDNDTWHVGVGVKKDEENEDEDHDNVDDLWGSGVVTQWGKDQDDYDGWGVDKWSKDKVISDSDSDRAASVAAVLPSRQRQRQQRRMAWSPPVWGAPKYIEPKTYYPPPPAPMPYYPPPPPAPKFVETCCTSGEKFCPIEFPMEKQVLLSGTVRVCCFTSRVYGNGGGGYYPHSYGGGGYYQTRTPPRYGGGSYGNRKLQYYGGYGGGGIYGQQPSYYGDSYRFPAQCPRTKAATRAPSSSPTKAPTRAPSSKPSKQPSLEFCVPTAIDPPTGNEACDLTTTGTIRAGSCKGINACIGTTGDVGVSSCIDEVVAERDRGVCQGSTGSSIGDNSCHGYLACSFNQGDIEDGSCLGARACLGNSGDVEEGSCKGNSACRLNEGNIGKNSCISEGDDLRIACRNNEGDIEDGSCLGKAACFFNEGDIGANSCIGVEACTFHKVAPIGAGSCKGERACAETTVEIPPNSCNGIQACCGITDVDKDLSGDNCDEDYECCVESPYNDCTCTP